MAATVTWTAKDPAEIKQYTMSYLGQFTYDYITASTWAVTVGGAALTVNSNSFTDNTTSVVLAAGTTGTAYTLVNTVTTSKGRVYKQSAALTVTSL